MIVGLGMDVVGIPRFASSLERSPRLRERLFAQSERGLPLSSLAARFAAKEALIKSVGDSTGFRWHDMTVVNDAEGKPSFETAGAVRARLDALGVVRVHLTLSHDAGIAGAVVVLEAAG